MKKVVLTFGIISGLICSVTMPATIPFRDKLEGDRGAIIGYTTMVLAGLFVFFGMRAYRENASGGKLTFARGFAVGILITLISNSFYVATWEFIYQQFVPDFAEKYAAQMVEHAKSSGASQQQIDETVREAEQFRRNYQKPRLQCCDHLPGSLPGLLGNHAAFGRDPAQKIRAGISVTF